MLPAQLYSTVSVPTVPDRPSIAANVTVPGPSPPKFRVSWPWKMASLGLTTGISPDVGIDIAGRAGRIPGRRPVKPSSSSLAVLIPAVGELASVILNAQVASIRVAVAIGDGEVPAGTREPDTLAWNS